ncbi:MAG: DNA polymerase III subunit alpha [Patescibacteria group bacterium]
MSAFVPLHVHSHYSLLKALPKIPDLVAKAKAEGCTALALTDIDNLYGAIDFYRECTSAGIKPIIGLDASVENGRLLLYAKNTAGYKNLLKIVTLTHIESAEGRPLTRPELEAHSDGLVILDPRDTTVALHETFYLAPDDARAWETMRAIANRGPADDGDINDVEESHHFYSVSEMAAQFSPEQLAKTIEVADQCNLEIVLGTFVFPEYPLPKGTTADELLRELCMAGLRVRGMEGRPDVAERLEYELGIIAFKGYAAYFLVVEDLIRFAREHDIYTNIRGSVAGSIVTYLLQITKIDPLEYNIPFERFLNPERPSAPDIDMDFADDRRDEVIEYTRAKYGGDRVAQIGTFGTMLARGVVRDVARALGYPYGLGDRIAKEIPIGSQGFPMTLERALEEAPDLKKMYDAEPDVREVIELGRKIEGCARHVGVHAAGVVVAPAPLVEYTPLQLDPKGGKIITQYDMYAVGEDGVGLTKFDFLGIRNLTMLASAVKLVRKLRNVPLDIETIPLDDKKTYEMLTRGETEATFQLNGAGMTRFLKELKPTSIHDINAMVALYRPGPMQFIPQYIERKHSPHLIRYFDPAMEPILKQTYGILVYQDDLLIIAHDLAGYSWGDVDKFRKAVGKKIPAEMAAQKEKFIKGCVVTSRWPQRKAEQVWEWIEPFAAYGFNKAHSASYGRVAYQTAYMKANYTVEYMAAVLTAEAGDVDTVATMVHECKRMGLIILPPDVNESFGDFTVILPGSIRFGLYSIKNFGRGVADEIIKEHKASGPFTSLSDFLSRIKTQGLNKKGLESLIMCGALDSMGERGQMLASMDLLLQFYRDAGADSGHDSLFAGMAEAQELKLPAAPEASMQDRLAWEKELLGLYISGHPLDRYKEKIDAALLKSNAPKNIGELLTNVHPGITTVTAGMVQDVRTILTKGGDQMAFIKLSDYAGTIEAVVFPKTFEQYKSLLQPESCIALKGRLSNRNGELSLVAEALKAL